MHRSLQIQTANDASTVYPLNVLYRKYTATQSQEGTLSWLIDSPGVSMLLDSDALVTFTIEGRGLGVGDSGLGNAFEGINPIGFPPPQPLGDDDEANTVPAPTNEIRLALRQGFCVLNAVDQVDLRINGELNSVRPGFWNGEFTRFFATQSELSSICSMSGGGELDSGNHSHKVKDDFVALGFNGELKTFVGRATDEDIQVSLADAYEIPTFLAVEGVNTTLNLRRSSPLTGEFHNPGLDARWRRMAAELRVQGPPYDRAALAGQTRYADAFSLRVTERIPIDPFLLWEKKDGLKMIPGVRRLELTYHLNRGNLANLILQGNDATGDGFTVNVHQTPPVLHLKWVVPPPLMQLVLPVTIPYTYMDEMTFDGSTSIRVLTGEPTSGVSTIAVHQLKLKAIPAMLMIYVKANRSATHTLLNHPTEKHLEIVNLRLSYTTAKGSFLEASGERLFSLYVKHSPASDKRQFNFDKWRKRYCTVVLKPEDHGIQFTDPGGPIIDLDLDVTSHWNFPGVGRDDQFGYDTAADAHYEVKVLAMYAWGLTMSSTDSIIAPLH